MDGVEWNGRSGMEWMEWNGMGWRSGVEWTEWNRNGMAEWNGIAESGKGGKNVGNVGKRRRWTE